jgi:hypothetical protein
MSEPKDVLESDYDKPRRCPICGLLLNNGECFMHPSDKPIPPRRSTAPPPGKKFEKTIDNPADPW